MPLIAALDVAYAEAAGLAAAACVRAADWSAAAPLDVATAVSAGLAPYEPGAFYKRELRALLAALERAPPADILLVDGYVWLDGAGAPGLGARLYEALGRRRPVVGLAKSALAKDMHSTPVLRGQSRRPLHVTAVGLDLAAAAAAVARMPGEGRLPALVKRCDRAAREALAAASGPS